MIYYETTLEEWKIQLKMSINFISSKGDSGEIRKSHTESHNGKTMMGSKT